MGSRKEGKDEIEEILLQLMYAINLFIQEKEQEKERQNIKDRSSGIFETKTPKDNTEAENDRLYS